MKGILLMISDVLATFRNLFPNIAARRLLASAEFAEALAGPLKSNDLTEDQLVKFTMDGKVRFVGNENPLDGRPSSTLAYTSLEIERALKATSLFELGHYGGVDTWLYLALQKYPIQGKTVGIIGSANQGYGPWYEALVLSQGAKPIVIEYNKIMYENDNISCLDVQELMQMSDKGIKLDALLCVSSIEHDGLGRYGDPINPDADLESMVNFKTLLKKDAILFLTVPVGLDSVIWNAHRIYGTHRLPLLLAAWQKVETFGFAEEFLDRDVGMGWEEKLDDGSPMFRHYPSYEPVFVLKNS